MEEKTQDKYQEPVEGDPIAAKEQPIEHSQETPQINIEQEPKVETPQSIKGTDLLEKKIVQEVAPATPVTPMPVQPTEDSKYEGQIKVLREIAFEKGLDAAIEEAKKLNNPYLLDEFHDDLVDNFYKKLVEAGKLEQR